jgi:hypothetical protein
MDVVGTSLPLLLQQDATKSFATMSPRIHDFGTLENSYEINPRTELNPISCFNYCLCG